MKNLDADKVCEDNWAFVFTVYSAFTDILGFKRTNRGGEDRVSPNVMIYTQLISKLCKIRTFQIQYQKELNKNCVDDKYYEQSEDELSEDMDFLGKMAVGDFDVDNIKECLEKFNDESEAICSI